MNLKKTIYQSLNTLSYVKRLNKEVNELRKELEPFRKNSFFPAGHYYSPIVLIDEIKKRESGIWDQNELDSINGIELYTIDQLYLLKQLSDYYIEMPFEAESQPNIRYKFENDFYSYTDGIILYSMIRHFKPKKIIEIGSGYSSAVMLDTNEIFFNKKIDLTFIDPYPDRLHSLLSDTDREQVTIIKDFIQNVSLNAFKKLQAGDMLFIDSSHVVKTGSDVNHILFEILPLLNTGVIIHFHDIFYPFEYPKQWVLEGRNWNEGYFLKAFLMYNNRFRIKLFSEYLHRFYKEAFSCMPLTYKNSGGSLWIEKQ